MFIDVQKHLIDAGNSVMAAALLGPLSVQTAQDADPEKGAVADGLLTVMYELAELQEKVSRERSAELLVAAGIISEALAYVVADALGIEVPEKDEPKPVAEAEESDLEAEVTDELEKAVASLFQASPAF